ncbi:FtsX-like permease family protein [Psychrobacillus psychrodurans]|uniref:FtsX-like permease family protein n=1 Tax=Psychrobacillus psychrodurans TaxID=126157 RepID=UPI0008E940AB|nr:ABC transporter permease [Psychrobacillus psychrodurans]MCZ8542435.1 ABC transporter permease [Psychrobacillus psychrodurans]SFN22766.1 putative ABC transport system permease protein [Psychrobacillus psychrodurans]
MTFRKFAFNNVIRNIRLYAAYLLSSMFMVMVFFTFSIFSFHPDLNGNGMSTSAYIGMKVSSSIIFVFSFFFILYSMSSFLQSRKKEFGLLMMQGMSMKQIRSMVFLENMVIGLFATISGIVLGLVFAKAILLLGENVLILNGKLNFYFPIQAILLTLVAFIALFFFISLFVSYILRSNKLITLIKGNEMSKGEPKANIFLTLLAAILLVAGYGTAVLAERDMVINVMIPVIVIVSIGTYLFFTQLSVYIIKRLKTKKKFFWKNTNMILFSDLSFRMKDNARTFFMVAMVSTVAFSAIGTLYGFQSAFIKDASNKNPYTFSYESYGENEEHDVQLINKALQKEKVKANSEHMMWTSYEMSTDWTLIAKESDFNRFAKLIGEDSIEVEEGQLVVVEYPDSSISNTEELMKQSVELKSGISLQPKEVIVSKALPEQYSYYVISDLDYENLPKPIDEMSFYAWQVTDGEEGVFAVSEELYPQLNDYQFKPTEYRVYVKKKQYASVMFVGLFIGIVFFVSAGSFLYFRLYMDLEEDKQKFKSIAKMGLTERELKKILSRQTMILFFTPITVAIIHGAVALTALSHLSEFSLVKESVTVLSVFFIIQVLYFFIVRYLYTKQVKAEVL